MTIIVNADLVRQLLPFTSNEGFRFYLSGINVEPHPDGGAWVVATDGHRMAIFHDSMAICDTPVIIKIPPAMAAACRPSKNKKMRLLTVDGKMAMLHEHPHVTAAEEINREWLIADNMLLACGDALIDADYPDWRKALPKELPTNEVGPFAVNPLLIAAFGKIGPGVSLHMSDTYSPIIVKVTARDDFVGALMPMRVDSWTSYPKWFLAEPNPASKPTAKKPIAKKPAAKKRAPKTKQSVAA